MSAIDLAPSPPPVESAIRRNRLKKSTPPLPTHAVVDTKPDPSPAIQAHSDQTRTIVAKINVGWGNTVYLRGEGGMLNWDLGVPMLCSGDDRWVWCCHADEAPRQFKFLRNDQDWAFGENQVLSGADITVCNPEFPR